MNKIWNQRDNYPLIYILKLNKGCMDAILIQMTNQ